jgi:monoamine oxidase
VSTAEADVVVVGAGLAGLAAARTLTAAGREVVVLEARDRVGGRTLNLELGPGHPGKIVEAGGQWIGPTQDRLAALAGELGVARFPTFEDGDHLVEVGGAPRRYRGRIPRLSPVGLADFAQAQLRLDRMARHVPLEAPWTARRAGVWDSQTFSSWMRRNLRTRAGRSLMEGVIQGVWAAEPADLSLLHVLFYVHSGGGLESLLATEGGAQQDRFVGGSQLISQRLAETLDVRLRAPVRRLEHGDGAVTAHADGLSVRARRAIVAVPLALAGRLAYDPPLPGLRDQLTQRVAQGSVIKCNVVYPEPFWREAGLSGQAGSATGPAKVIYDNSPPDGNPGVLVAFLEGALARELGTWPAQHRRDAVLTGLRRLFGPRIERPEAFHEQIWADEEWSRGGYGSYFPPGGWTSFGRALRAPVGPLHWAGSEYAERWSGYMDGAVRSGESTAAAVLEAL